MAEVIKEKGICRWFNSRKGYGFIKKDSDGKDVFVHYTAINMEGYKAIKTGDIVDFVVTQGDKGPQVSDVVILKSAPENMTTEEALGE